MLVEAFDILESEICHECGNPTWLCRSTERDITFKIDKQVCFAKRALVFADAKRNKREMSKEDKDEAGVSYTAYPALQAYSSISDLPTRTEFKTAKFKLDSNQGGV